MSLRAIWSATYLKEIFDAILASGGTRIAFATISDAENFRYACYKYRTKNNIAKDFSFVIDTGGTDKLGEPIIYVLIQKTPNFKLIRESATK